MSYNHSFNGRHAFVSEVSHRMCNVSPTKLAEILTAAGVAFNPNWVQEYSQKGIVPKKPKFCDNTYSLMSEGQVNKMLELLPAAEEYTATSMGKPVNVWKDEYGNVPALSPASVKKEAPKRAQVSQSFNPPKYVIEEITDELKSRVFGPQTAEVERIINSFAEDKGQAEREKNVAETKNKQDKRERIQKETESAKANPLYQAVRDIIVAVIAEEGAEYFDEDAIEKVVKRTMGEHKVGVDESAVVKLIQKHAGAVTRVEVNCVKTEAVTFTGTAHRLFPKLLKLMQCGFPIWIPGPAGSGKTTAVNHACKALGATLYMPPEGPIENKYGMIGYMDASGKFVEPTLYKAAKEASENPDKQVVYFIDECDAGYANALMVLNAVMENGYCTFANGERVEYGRNLMFIAGANTFGNGATNEYVGRNKLDAATLDRFVTLAWDYDEDLERAIAGHDEWVRKVQRIRKAVQDAAIKTVVTPRASIRGAKLIASGFSEDEALAMVVFKGMTADQVRSIKSRI